MNNTTTAPLQYIKDETIKVHMKAMINNREANDMVSKVARHMVDSGEPMPEEFDDIFSIEIVTRPSGSKYAVVSFV